MTTATKNDIDRSDLLQAVAFAEKCFNDWHANGLLRDAPHQAIFAGYTKLRQNLEFGTSVAEDVQLRSADVCWSCKHAVATDATDCDECGAPAHTPDTQKLRYLVFVCHEIKRLYQAGQLAMAESDGCMADANQRITAVRRKLDAERIPLAVAADAPLSGAAGVNRPRPPRRAATTEPRRNLMEILLDPRSIQWLLVSGGVLLVLGLVIWLAAEGIFQNRLFLAVCLGIGNAALLAGGWALIAYTRYQMAGRALTLLACLLMPLNLWFYNAQGLITLSEGGHLWIPAVVCCALYAVSARLLRDPIFVYVLVAGVTMTGLLILADRDLNRFAEIVGPSTLLVCLGLLCIHAERIFAEDEGPFSRRRFGLAFFWSGHVVLASGLLLVLGAQIWGQWFYNVFAQWDLTAADKAPDIVTTEGGKLIALCLVLAGTYAYAYSDLVVRRIGVYIYLAVFSLLWAEVLVLDYLIWKFGWKLPVAELLIIALAVTGLIANLTLSQMATKQSSLLRASGPLGLCLSVLPVVLGVWLHFRSNIPEGFPGHYALTGTYVIAMLAAAVSCRVSAHLFRHTNPALSMTYFFGTGAATLAGAAGLLVVMRPGIGWQGQAPLLMLIPLLYLAAARLYQGHSQEKPLLWVAHAATIVMLISSIGTTFQGFLLIAEDRLNLSLALFFAEATVFYLLESLWRKHDLSVYACTATACAAVWQLLKYAGVMEEYYILTFAVVGLLLLVAYRFAVLENMNFAGLGRAAFHSGNALLSLAFVAGALLVLSELVAGNAAKSVLITLLFTLIVISLLAVALVRQQGWRRWYVAASVTNAALVVLVLALLGNLTMPQKLEIVCVVIGLLLLAVGHVGWYREQEQANDLVSASLFFGSVLVAVPLAIAVLYCRSVQPNFDTFHTLNELGMLAVGLLLLATGFMFQIKSTTLTGAFLSVLYLVSLVLFLRVPEKLQTTAVYIMVGGGLFFGVGLLLSLYRDRLLALPERIKRREGVFRVLTWR
jgi:hypothetical protein